MSKPIKGWILAAVLTAIYIAGLAVGYFVIRYMSGEWKRHDMEYYASQSLEEFQETGRASSWVNSGMAAIIYDQDGIFRNFFRLNGDIFTMKFIDQTEEALPKVLSGERTLEVYAFTRNYSKKHYTSYIYVGVPIKEQGEITGAYFWVKESADMAETMMGVFAVFTLVFSVVTGFLLSNMQAHNRYEKARRRYIDNITHEMKSPVASIKALAEALTDGMAKDENARNVYYGMIIGEANRQETMIQDALTLAKLQTRHSRQTIRKKLSAEQLFRPFCEKQSALCELLDVHFVVDESIRNLQMVQTDADLIWQVLETVVGNARKFAGEGGTIALSAEVQRKRYVICVADNGPGIPGEDIPFVFERFYRGVQSGNGTGSGLGLAIAKESLTALREKIWIRSRPGEGTQVYFTITRA